MKFISCLTDADKAVLERLHREGATHRQRQRAQAMLLSAQGFTLVQLTYICGVHRNTVSGWLDAWQERGLSGLEDAPKTGCPPKIDVVIREYLHEMLENPSPNMKALALDEIKKRVYKVFCGFMSSLPRKKRIAILN